jgi:hypothetical protein
MRDPVSSTNLGQSLSRSLLAKASAIWNPDSFGFRPNFTPRACPRFRPSSVRVTRGADSGQHLASVLQEGRENANIDVGIYLENLGLYGANRNVLFAIRVSISEAR